MGGIRWGDYWFSHFDLSRERLKENTISFIGTGLYLVLYPVLFLDYPLNFVMRTLDTYRHRKTFFLTEEAYKYPFT